MDVVGIDMRIILLRFVSPFPIVGEINTKEVFPKTSGTPGANLMIQLNNGTFNSGFRFWLEVPAL